MVALFGSVLTCLYQLHVHTLRHSDYSPRTDMCTDIDFMCTILRSLFVLVSSLTTWLVHFLLGGGWGGWWGSSMLCNIMQHMKTFIPNGLAVNYGKSGLLNVIFGTASASRNGRLWETAPPWPKKKEGGRSHVANGDATLFIPLAKHFFWDVGAC